MARSKVLIPHLFRLAGAISFRKDYSPPSSPPSRPFTWADLEKQFHKYFFSGVHEKNITDLVRLRQHNDESVESFVQRLRDVKNKCYSLVLDDRQLADLDFQELLPHIKDKYASQEFESLSHMVQRISDEDIKAFEPRKAWNKKVSFVDEATSLDSDEEPVIGLAEWVKNKKPMSCPFGQKELEKFAFDITKADRIFDFLLQEGQIKLSPNHVIPSAKELKKIKYCKWHNATSHNTNECKVFRQQLQLAIESGRIKFVSVFFPRGVTPTSKFVCVLPFPDGDARRHRGLSWFEQEKALRPAGGESLYYLAP